MSIIKTEQAIARAMLAVLAVVGVSVAQAQDKASPPAGALRPPGIWGLAFSPDGHWLAAATATSKQGGPIVVWKVDDWKPHIVCFEDSGGSDVAFSPSGEKFAYATKGPWAAILDVRSGSEARRWKADETRLFCVAYSPDGRTLATSAANGRVKLWNVENSELVRSFQAHEGDCYQVAFSPDGKLLLSGGQDAAAKLWNVETGELKQTFKPSDLIVRRVRWSRDGLFFLCCRWGGYVRIRETATGTLRAYIRGGSKWADLTRDNGLLVTNWWRKEARVYRLDLRQPSPQQEQSVRQLIAKLKEDDYAVRETVSRQLAETGMVAAPILREFTQSADAEVRIRTRRLRREVMSPEPIARLKGHAGDVEVVCFSPDATLIATGCRGGDVKIWDAKTFQERITPTAPSTRASE